MVEQFRRRNWYIGNKETYALCPKCFQLEEEKKEVNKVVTQSGYALRKQRQIFHLLDEHFNVEAGRYNGDWSDKKIAAETNMAESHIAKVRDEAYGPLKTDPALVKLRDEIQETRKALANEMREIKSLAASVEKQFAAKILELEKKYTALATKR